MRGDEKTAMINMLDSYISHIKNSNNKSLLARIYGIFTIKTPLINSIDLIILQNTADFFKINNKFYEFDLKGSTVGRYTNCLNYFLKFNVQKTLKDKNLAEIQQILG